MNTTSTTSCDTGYAIGQPCIPPQTTTTTIEIPPPVVRHPNTGSETTELVSFSFILLGVGLLFAYIGRRRH